MRRIAEKPDLLKIKAVKVWVQAWIKRLSELKNHVFSQIISKMAARMNFLDLEQTF
jgi:hypothetical protein